MTRQEMIDNGLIAPCDRCGLINNIGMILDDAQRRGDRQHAESVVIEFFESNHNGDGEFCQHGAYWEV